MSITLCSVSPDEYRIFRAYCQWIVVPARPKNAFYSSVTIGDSKDAKVFYQSLSEKEVVPVDIPASDIVRDIFQSDQLEAKGVFVLRPGYTEPTADELALALEKRHNLLVTWATEGDRLFSQYGERGIQHIPDFCKRAVKELGESRDWVFTGAIKKTECNVCGAMLRNLSSGLPPAICRECNSILDPSRVSAAPVAAPKKMGRPKKKEVEAVVTV